MNLKTFKSTLAAIGVTEETHSFRDYKDGDVFTASPKGDSKPGRPYFCYANGTFDYQCNGMGEYIEVADFPKTAQAWKELLSSAELASLVAVD